MTIGMLLVAFGGFLLGLGCAVASPRLAVPGAIVLAGGLVIP